MVWRGGVDRGAIGTVLRELWCRQPDDKGGNEIGRGRGQGSNIFLLALAMGFAQSILHRAAWVADHARRSHNGINVGRRFGCDIRTRFGRHRHHRAGVRRHHQLGEYQAKYGGDSSKLAEEVRKNHGLIVLQNAGHHLVMCRVS